MPRAIQMQSYGPPEVLEVREVDLRPLGSGEVRFRVLAAAVNYSDLQIRGGVWPILAAQPFPYTPGLEALGDVTEVAPDVSWPPVGERVITMMQKLGGIHGLRPGGYQELVTVQADAVAVVPRMLDPLAVAALGLAGVTAWNGIRRLELRPGSRAVVHGASGGVGACAIALAKALGAQVIATTSSEAKREPLLSLGADEAVSTSDRAWTERIGNWTVDGILDTVGGELFGPSVGLLARGGRLCLVGAASGGQVSFDAWSLLEDLQLTGWSSEHLTGTGLREDMAKLCQWLDEGRISAPPYRTFSLAQAAEVHALMEARRLTGRALLLP